MGSLLEAVMMLCFGLSWPINVIKAYKARTAKGTSLPFILLITFGYLAGITAKIVSGQINYVLAVYFRNTALDRKAAQTAETAAESEPVRQSKAA